MRRLALLLLLPWTHALAADAPKSEKLPKGDLDNAGPGTAGDEGGPEASSEAGGGKAVPTGKAKGKAPKNAPGSANKSEAATPKSAPRHCLLDLTAPPGGNIVFAADQQTVYFLAASPASKKDKNEAGSERARHTVYRIHSKSRKAEALLSLDHRIGAGIVPLGDPIAAISVLAFGGKNSSCHEGPGVAVHVNLDKPDEPGIQQRGTYALVAAPQGLAIVDQKKGQILELDPVTFQTKKSRKVPGNDRPLWYDPQAKKLITWHERDDQRGLALYVGEGATPARQLAIKKGDRVLQKGGDFAVAHPLPAANAIEIVEVKGWTQGVSGSPGRYRINLPAAYGIAAAGMDIHFMKRLALVQGANFVAKARWQRIFLFDYTKSEPLVAVPVTGKQYIHAAAIDPLGTYVLVELRDQEKKLTDALKLYDFSKKSFSDINLPRPETAVAPAAKKKGKPAKSTGKSEGGTDDEDESEGEED